MGLLRHRRLICMVRDCHLSCMRPARRRGPTGRWGSALDGAEHDPRDEVPLHERVHAQDGRSEEHTSELQSRGHLVCRLLLEKKKKKKKNKTGDRNKAHTETAKWT